MSNLVAVAINGSKVIAFVLVNQEAADEIWDGNIQIVCLAIEEQPMCFGLLTETDILRELAFDVRVACEMPTASPTSCLSRLKYASTRSPRRITKRCAGPSMSSRRRSTVIVSRSSSGFDQS